jgi:hypothetical protein
MAIGGFDGTTYLKTIEIYDIEQQMWKLYNSMIYRRLGGGVGVVKLDRIQDSVLFNKSPTNIKETKNSKLYFLVANQN